MHCFIYAHEELIGEADFIVLDSGMGVTSAPFRPNENYEKIRPAIRAYSLLGTLADINATEETKAYAAEVQRRCDSLGLTTVTVSGEMLEMAGGISISDYFEELEDDPYEVTLLGLSRNICEKYFPETN